MSRISQHNLYKVIAIGAMTIATLLIYWPGLQGPLLLDDGPQLKPILNGINGNNWSEQYKEYILSTSSIFKRPVSMATFILNAVLADNDIWYWKLTNVVLHILTGCVIFFLARIILSLHKNNNGLNINIASIFITTAWLIHPLQVSTVLYLVQRMTILSTFFTLCALFAYIKGFINEVNNKNGIIYLLFSALILFPLALLSKENSAIFPIYVLITTIYVSKCKSITLSKTPKSVKLYNLFMLLIVIIGSLVLITNNDKLIFDSYKYFSFTLYERILTEPRVLFMYLAQIIIPSPSWMGFFHDDFIVSTDLFNPYTTFLCVFFLSFITIVSITSFNKSPLAAYSLLLFLSSHLIESTIFPLEIAFEHRNYIGILGILLFLFTALSSIIRFKLLMVTPIIFVLTFLTLQRVTIWGNANTMYQHMLSVHPNSKRLNTLFADAYSDAGQHDNALKILLKHNGLGVELHRLIIQCRHTRKLPSGVFINLIQTNNNIFDNYELDKLITLSNLGLDEECNFKRLEFIELLKSITTYSPSKAGDVQKLLMYLAHYHRVIGNSNESITALEKSFASNRSNPIPLFLMVEWLIEDNKISDANKIFIKAKRISNNNLYDHSDFIDRITKILSLHNNT